MMGTYVSITLPVQYDSLFSTAFKRLQTVENSLSSYKKDADIYKLNLNKESVISPDTYEAFCLAKKYYKRSDGYFDITIGSITKKLFYFGENELIPARADLDRAEVNFKKLTFNRNSAVIAKNITLDLGGMGKGFGVDKVVSVLKNHGVTRGVVALSGDMRCLHKCYMAIQNPFEEGSFFSFKMSYSDTGISTSGNYRRYVKNRNYNHLIDPNNHKSEDLFASITLISKKLKNSDLDAYATASCVMPFKKAFNFLNSIHELGYFVITNNKKIYYNKEFKRLTTNRSIKLFDLKKSSKTEYIKAVPLTFQSSKKRSLLSKRTAHTRE